MSIFGQLLWINWSNHEVNELEPLCCFFFFFVGAEKDGANGLSRLGVVKKWRAIHLATYNLYTVWHSVGLLTRSFYCLVLLWPSLQVVILEPATSFAKVPFPTERLSHWIWPKEKKKKGLWTIILMWVLWQFLRIFRFFYFFFYSALEVELDQISAAIALQSNTCNKILCSHRTAFTPHWVTLHLHLSCLSSFLSLLVGSGQWAWSVPC